MPSGVDEVRRRGRGLRPRQLRRVLHFEQLREGQVESFHELATCLGCGKGASSVHEIRQVPAREAQRLGRPVVADLSPRQLLGEAAVLQADAHIRDLSS